MLNLLASPNVVIPNPNMIRVWGKAIQGPMANPDIFNANKNGPGTNRFGLNYVKMLNKIFSMFAIDMYICQEVWTIFRNIFNV